MAEAAWQRQRQRPLLPRCWDPLHSRGPLVPACLPGCQRRESYDDPSAPVNSLLFCERGKRAANSGSGRSRSNRRKRASQPAIHSGWSWAGTGSEQASRPSGSSTRENGLCCCSCSSPSSAANERAAKQVHFETSYGRDDGLLGVKGGWTTTSSAKA